VSFAGVAAFNTDFTPFSQEWKRLLSENGLQEFSCKKVFNAKRPLSKKNSDTGVDKRIEDLLPFVLCIRKYLQVITGLAFDAKSFRELRSHLFQALGTDPSYTAFLRALMRILEFTPSGDRIVLVCDDEESTAWTFYKLYRRVKKVWPEAKTKLVALSFGDDSFLYGLQASDLVSSLIRLQARKELLAQEYDYHALFEAMSKQPDRHERLWDMSVAIVNKENLKQTANGLHEAYKEYQRANKQKAPR
jgi:hypothetical protein